MKWKLLRNTSVSKMKGALKHLQLEKVHLASLSVKPTSGSYETSHVSPRHHCFLADPPGTLLHFPSALHTNLWLFQLLSVLLLKKQYSIFPICWYQQLWLPIYLQLSILSLPRGAPFSNQIVKPLLTHKLSFHLTAFGEVANKTIYFHFLS